MPVVILNAYENEVQSVFNKCTHLKCKEFITDIFTRITSVSGSFYNDLPETIAIFLGPIFGFLLAI